MKNVAVLGGTFGDEGKGSFTHYLSPNFNWVVRTQGGANAGHTFYRNGKKVVHNLLPCVNFWRNYGIKAFLGSGMVIDLEQLIKEIENEKELSKEYYKLDLIKSKIYVDPDAFIVTQAHKDEDAAKNGHIGSTNRGIGPAYLNKINRNGTRVKDYIRDNNPLIEKLKSLGVIFAHSLELYDDFMASNILFEGAQGVLLDINHGTYPYVTCSDCTVSGIYSAGFNFIKLDKVYGITKCYSTRVGEGPYPTEIFGEQADKLREAGKEYGATTGRPRRVGWLDLPMLKYACIKGGITDLVITKLDILENYNQIPICVNYLDNDKVIDAVCPNDFFMVKPEYINMIGWGKLYVDDKSSVKQVSHNWTMRTRDYISLIESKVNCKVGYITTGVSEADILKV